mgnify:CR=1 FL=1
MNFLKKKIIKNLKTIKTFQKWPFINFNWGFSNFFVWSFIVLLFLPVKTLKHRYSKKSTNLSKKAPVFCGRGYVLVIFLVFEPEKRRIITRIGSFTDCDGSTIKAKPKMTTCDTAYETTQVLSPKVRPSNTTNRYLSTSPLYSYNTVDLGYYPFTS